MAYQVVEQILPLCAGLQPPQHPLPTKREDTLKRPILSHYSHDIFYEVWNIRYDCGDAKEGIEIRRKCTGNDHLQHAGLHKCPKAVLITTGFHELEAAPKSGQTKISI